MTEVLALLKDLAARFDRLEAKIEPKPVKEWFDPAEVAALFRKTAHHVRERWCNQGRIQCAKDPDTGRWRIPHAEVERLQAGGLLQPKRCL